MFCRRCGAQLNDSAAFCRSCGQPVLSADPSGTPAGATEAPAAAPVEHQMTEATMPLPVLEAQAMPLESAVAPGAVPAVPAQQAQPPAQPPAQAPTGRNFNVALLVAGIIAAVLLLGGGGLALYFTGTLEPLGIAPPSTTSSSESASGAEDNEEGGGSSESEESAPAEPETLTEAESYGLLEDHYAALWSLHCEIGLANADGTYGGVGFAYDVFNPKIGHPDYNVRSQLAAECQALADKVSASRLELAQAPVDAAYAPQRDALLGLYDLLAGRTQAMLGAATIAVDRPDEPSWRPTLSPASVDTRTAFEAAYPGAVPQQR